jgi:mannose-6-phosphate isomerase-like protein (cupin superfamily)
MLPQDHQPAQVFDIHELEQRRAASGVDYLQFLKEPSMRLGVYTLAVGAEDQQSPHEEDEVYYVVSGQGTLRAGPEEHPVQPGSIVFVAARVPHKFHSIKEALQLVVFFAANG